MAPLIRWIDEHQLRQAGPVEREVSAGVIDDVAPICTDLHRRSFRLDGAALSDPEALEHGRLHQIEEDREDDGRSERAGHHPRRQRRHCNPSHGQDRGDQEVGDGRKEKPDTGT
jgi:hypothetical protein